VADPTFISHKVRALFDASYTPGEPHVPKMPVWSVTDHIALDALAKDVSNGTAGRFPPDAYPYLAVVARDVLAPSLTARADQAERAYHGACIVHERHLKEAAERVQQAEATTRRLEAERDMLRGVGCCEAKEGEPASGPCGVCVKCLKAEAQRLREALEQAREYFKDDGETDVSVSDVLAAFDAALAGTPEGPS